MNEAEMIAIILDLCGLVETLIDPSDFLSESGAESIRTEIKEIRDRVKKHDTSKSQEQEE